MPSKAISVSTIWASRWISSAARSMTPLVSAPLGLGIGVAPSVAMGYGQLRGHGLRRYRVPGRRALHDGTVEALRWLRTHQIVQPGQSAYARGILAGRLDCRCCELRQLPVRQNSSNAWFGVRYSITLALDIHPGLLPRVGDNTFAGRSVTTSNCALLFRYVGSSSSVRPGTLDAVSSLSSTGALPVTSTPMPA